MAPTEVNGGANGLTNGAAHTNGTHTSTTNGTKPKLPVKANSYSAKFQLADHFIGGNRLENAPPSKVKNFVIEQDGHTVITNVSSSQPMRGNGD